MATEGVPYFSPAKRVTVVVLVMAAGIATVASTRLASIEDGVVIVVWAIAAIALVCGACRQWFIHTCPRMTRIERQTRYAIDTLHAPYWQALLMHGAPAATTPLVMVLLENGSTEKFVVLLIAILPIAYLAAAATLYFERRRAQRLLGEAAAEN